MNIISYAIAQVRREIAHEVLQQAFKPAVQNWRQPPLNLDNEILMKVLRARVLIDANIVSGEACLIDMSRLVAEYMDDYCMVFQIPAELTANREIMSVLGVSYMPYNSQVGGYGVAMQQVGNYATNDTLTTVQQMADSHSNIPHVGTTQADLVGFNKIRITDPIRTMQTYLARVFLTNDSNLNNIDPRSFFAFSQLCVWAAKAYVFWSLNIKIDQGYLQGGQELGAFSNIVREYADAEKNYQTELNENWRAVATMNNREQHERLMRIQIPIGL